MAKFMHQIIFCSERERRAFQREIQVGEYNAVVTDVQKLPPFYDMALERMRENNEEVMRYTMKKITIPREFQNCPYCGRDTLFICGCGVLSCTMSSGKTHTCPSCKRVQESVNTDNFPMSNSGFVHSGGSSRVPDDRRPAPAVDRTAQALPGPRPLELPSPDKEDARARVRKFLSDQRKPGEGDKS